MLVEDFLTVADAGRLAGVTPQTIRLAADEGRLPVAVLSSRGWRFFLKADVEKYAAAVARRSRRKAA